jgi:phospholipid/cholesterol/gamma-HCH transport system ATP-binding protein
MQTIINVETVSIYLGSQWILRDINFKASQGEIVAIAGGSGSGKTTLLRGILLLLRPSSGKIELFGSDILHMKSTELQKIQQKCGVMFQGGALFSSLTVLENLIFPLRKFTKLPLANMRELALLKLALVGLPPETANKYPSELSGGMQKRVALARALILDPQLLFLDEPGSGLDPISLASQDDLLVNLQAALGLTIVMVTHDLSTLENITDKIIFLGDKKVIATGSFAELKQSKSPEVHTFFNHRNKRAVKDS